MAPINNKRKFQKSLSPSNQKEPNSKKSAKTEKKPPLRGGILKLTQTDKKELATAQTGIWVTIPRTVIKGKTHKECVSELREIIASRKLKNLKASVLCGPTYLVLVFDTKKDRDAALDKLSKLDFNIWGKKVQPIFKEFGEEATAKQTVWRVRGGILDTPKHIKKAVKDHFSEIESDYNSKFYIRTILHNDVSNQQFAIKFDKTPPWTGKHIIVRGQSRQVSIESPNKCALCKEQGHTGWDCRGINKKTLSEEVISGTARSRLHAGESEGIEEEEEAVEMSTGE